MARTVPPDIIVSNTLSPEMDGFRLCRELQLNPATKNIPFIFYLTSERNPKNKQLALSMGAAGYLTRSGQADPLLKIVRDLTNKTEKEKLPSQEKDETPDLYKHIFINSKDAIIILNPEGKYLQQNPSNRSLFQYSDEELEGEKIAVLFGQKSHSDISILDSEKGLTQEEIVLHSKSGNRIEVEISTFPILDQNKKMAYTVIIFRDIRKRKKKEHLLQKENLESIGKLTGKVAHKLNNLLTPIIGYVDILLGQPLEEPKMQDGLHMIQKAAHRAAGLSKEFLSFSHQIPPNLKPHSLRDLVFKADPLLRQNIDQEMELTIQSSDHLWPVLIDSEQIHQVFLSLCMNAIDTVRECKQENDDFHPSIQIKMENTHIDEQYCNTQSDAKIGEFVCLSVTDNGMGIDEEALPHLFEPFFKSKNLRGHGTGLGLASSHGIVVRHKGWIGVKTAKGKGTSFKVYLPRTKGSLPVEKLKEKKFQPDAQASVTIMIVDDDELVRSVGETVLKERGYRVLLANDGEQALETFKQKIGGIDVVILDLAMPGLSGWEVLTNLRLLDPELKVIISSAHIIPPPLKGTKKLQSFMALPKPFRPSDMERAVQKILETGTRHEPNRRNPDNVNFKGKERRSGYERRRGSMRRSLKECRSA